MQVKHKDESEGDKLKGIPPDHYWEVVARINEEAAKDARNRSSHEAPDQATEVSVWRMVESANRLAAARVRDHEWANRPERKRFVESMADHFDTSADMAAKISRGFFPGKKKEEEGG